jgi:hypothetical protein
MRNPKTLISQNQLNLTKKFNLPKFILFVEIIGIFICALCFRVTNLGLIEFKADEATNLLLASKPIFGYPMPPATTASSVGILNPPLLNFLLYPLALISLDPRIISGLIGIINSISIVCFYLIIKKYYSRTLAIITALLLSFSPWMILYSRKIWAQDFIIPLFIPVFFSIHKIIIEKDNRYWFFYTLFSLLLIQLHQTNILFLLPLTLFIFLSAVKISISYIVIGLFLGFIPMIPYVKYEINHNCPDCQILINLKSKLANKNLTIHFLRPLQITNQGNFQYILGSDMLTFKNKYPLIYSVRKIYYLQYILIPIGLLLFWNREKKLRSVIYATFLLPVLYFWLKVEQPMHYHIIISPILFLSLGYILAILIVNKNKIISYGSIILFILFIVLSGLFNYSFYSLISAQNGANGDYGETYNHKQIGVLNKLVGYVNDPAYSEMFLTDFIDPRYFRATDPVPKLIYDRIIIEKHLSELFHRLTKVPEDRRVIFELLYYYTDPPTINTLRYLQKNSQSEKGYSVFLHEFFDIYLNNIQNNGKKYVSSKYLGISFEIPQIWDETENKNIVQIKSNLYSLVIHKNTTLMYPNSKIIKSDSDLTVEIYPPTNDNNEKEKIQTFLSTIGYE